jgi:16S rRNA (adenine1518-N6/adenine1519-N6)-dimethyltransferase
LIDKNVLKKIIEAAGLSPNDVVLEIGPGLGILTLELAMRVKKVIAVEKDKKMCDILLEMLDVRNVGNVEIVNQDILKFDPYTLHPKPYTLVGNLPYYITSPVIRKFLETDNPPREMILMVQKEVAQRICAQPPHMNLLAVAVQFYAEPKIISYVSKNSFWPRPRVDSAIIKIEPLNKTELSGTDTELFFNLVRAGFSSKRKMLKNNLKIDESILRKLGLNPKIRAENLTIDDWVKLYENL